MPVSNESDLLFRCLADPTRRVIFEHLCLTGEASVGKLRDHVGISQPGVSKHLAVLKEAGLVIDRQEGRHAYYRARVEALAPLADWTSRMTAFWNTRLDDLDNLLKRMDN